MKGRGGKARSPIMAAGGIVLRGLDAPRFAIVRLRKYDSWVLPKGKLNRNESALAAARREVLEEVGHKVHIHEFLGTISYEVGSRAKVVQFWRMQAIGDRAGRLMRDVRAVEWLPLDEAIERLTHPREQEFLRNVGPVALQALARGSPTAQSIAEPAPIGQAEPAVAAEPATQSIGEDLPQSAVPAVRHDVLARFRAWLRRTVSTIDRRGSARGDE